MNNIIAKLAAAVVMVSMVAGAAVAAPGKPNKAVPCPVCKMGLSKKKDKTHTVAVRLKKGAKVMYCCAGCSMPDSVLVKPGTKGK